MQSKALWVTAALAVFSCAMAAVIFWRTTDIDEDIKSFIVSADIELQNVERHEPEVRERVVVIREQTAQRILSLSGDDLVAVAISRADSYRRRLTASNDIQGARGISIK